MLCLDQELEQHKACTPATFLGHALSFIFMLELNNYGSNYYGVNILSSVQTIRPEIV